MKEHTENYYEVVSCYPEANRNREAVAYFTEYMIKNTVQINFCLQILKVTKRLLYLQQNYKKDLFMEDKKKLTINFDKAPTEEEMKMKPSAVRISVIEGTKKKK